MKIAVWALAAAAATALVSTPSALAHETSICAAYEQVPAGYIVWSIQANAASCGNTHRLNIKNDVRREDSMCEGYHPVPAGYRVLSAKAGSPTCAYRTRLEISNRNS
ncbi:hypothetical protein ACFWNN_09760 [Lentzea sp. NPDC058450]|uniref:hypothetical protein n=1 Tax=Lentzea sp. NPDC058450 TaxID=3346505 RepID=UPI00364F0513